MLARKLTIAAALTALAGSALAGPPQLIQSPIRESAPPPFVVPGAPIPVIQQPIQPMSVDDFACSFQPAAGTYRVTLIHPKTCCPVDVCFTLPCGCAKKITTTKYTMRIVYPGLFNDVVIRFRLDGSVSVRGA
jgi:hypothetical protein